MRTTVAHKAINFFQRSPLLAWVTFISAHILLLLPFSVFLPSVHAGLYQHSYALVIGIDDYPADNWGSLNYAVKDAKGIAEFLKQQGFTVKLLLNEKATRTKIIQAMQNDLSRKVQRGDRVLVFFAGHGYTEVLGGVDFGYLVPYDGQADSATYLSMDTLQTQSVKMGNAKHQLFIMDACYGGLLASRRSSAVPVTHPDYLNEVTSRLARQILTAGGKGQEVLDGGPDGHSVFTGYLLKALQEGKGDLNGDGYITFAELTSYIIPAATVPNVQTPLSSVLAKHEAGEFVFQAPGGQRIQIESPPVPNDRGRRSQATEEEPNSIEVFNIEPDSDESSEEVAVIARIPTTRLPAIEPVKTEIPDSADEVCESLEKIIKAAEDNFNAYIRFEMQIREVKQREPIWESMGGAYKYIGEATIPGLPYCGLRPRDNEYECTTGKWEDDGKVDDTNHGFLFDFYRKALKQCLVEEPFSWNKWNPGTLVRSEAGKSINYRKDSFTITLRQNNGKIAFVPYVGIRIKAR